MNEVAAHVKCGKCGAINAAASCSCYSCGEKLSLSLTRDNNQENKNVNDVLDDPGESVVVNISISASDLEEIKKRNERESFKFGCLSLILTLIIALILAMLGASPDDVHSRLFRSRLF